MPVRRRPPKPKTSGTAGLRWEQAADIRRRLVRIARAVGVRHVDPRRLVAVRTYGSPAHRPRPPLWPPSQRAGAHLGPVADLPAGAPSAGALCRRSDDPGLRPALPRRAGPRVDPRTAARSYNLLRQPAPGAVPALPDTPHGQPSLPPLPGQPPAGVVLERHRSTHR